MENLNANWFVEGLVDFEYKKYVLLAYLDLVKKQFNQTKLYPQFSDLIGHHRNLSSFKEGKTKMAENFPQALTGIDIEAKKLEYENREADDSLMKEIDLIVDYALPLLKGGMEEGKEIYEFIEGSIDIDPVGIMPLFKDEGYLLVQGGSKPTVEAFDYKVSIIESQDERFRSIRTSYVTSFDWGITNTFENMKLELIRANKALPNPATFVVASSMEFPRDETFMPVARRKFIRYLSAFNTPDIRLNT